MAAWSTGQANLTGNGDPERVGAGQVTANIFQALGAVPMLGRGFREGEDATGDGAAVVLLGHGLWQRRFGGDPALVGKTIQLDGRSFEVIGVMPQGFRLPTDFREDFAEPTELWTPLVLDTDPDQPRQSRPLRRRRAGARRQRRAGQRRAEGHHDRLHARGPLSRADAL